MVAQLHPSADKASLRRQALAARARIAPPIAAQFSARLAQLGLQLAQKLQASVVSAFYPIGDEPDTLALLGALAGAGLRTALPITVGRGQALIFRLWRPGEPTLPGAMKIPEPLASAATVEPDLLFVPLAVFDRRGHRIGYGAGHYDRTLALLRDKRHTIAVGVAYSVSKAARLPEEAHDQRLDYVLTEHEFIDCRGADNHLPRTP